MSRTLRVKPPKIKLGELAKQPKSKKVKDGTPTKSASSCQNHGGCKWCLGNRMHKHAKAQLGWALVKYL